MKIGMNLLLWTPAADMSHISVLDDLKSWGYDGAEFPMFDPACSPWGELAKYMDSIGLERTAVTIVSHEANPVSDDPAIRKAGCEYLKRCIDSCAELGATRLTGPLFSPCGGLVGRGRTDDEFKWCVEIMREAAEHAAKVHVSLGLEALNRFETYVFNSQEDGAKMAEAVDMPNFGLLYDTFHANIEEKDVGAVIRKIQKHIVHIHISENDRSTPGRGQVHWAETFEAIKETGYDDWLVIEAFGRAMPEVAAATCIWRQMFETEEQLAREGLAFIRKNIQ